MSDELVVFPVPIGHYVHHPPLDVDAEVARVVELFAEFSGREAPWAVDVRAGDRGGEGHRLARTRGVRCRGEARRGGGEGGHGMDQARAAVLGLVVEARITRATVRPAARRSSRVPEWLTRTGP